MLCKIEGKYFKLRDQLSAAITVDLKQAGLLAIHINVIFHFFLRNSLKKPYQPVRDRKGKKKTHDYNTDKVKEEFLKNDIKVIVSNKSIITYE